MGDLCEQLEARDTGCVVGNRMVNHLMYADDLVILSPCGAGLQQLLRIFCGYGLQHDIRFNSQKSVVMTGRAKGDQFLQFPSFFISSEALSVVIFRTHNQE